MSEGLRIRVWNACMRLGLETPSPRQLDVGDASLRQLAAALECAVRRCEMGQSPLPATIEAAVAIAGRVRWVQPGQMGDDDPTPELLDSRAGETARVGELPGSRQTRTMDRVTALRAHVRRCPGGTLPDAASAMNFGRDDYGRICKLIDVANGDDGGTELDDDSPAPDRIVRRERSDGRVGLWLAGDYLLHSPRVDVGNEDDEAA
ncbi:MAG: hypothetical protein WAZ94_13365 [Phycisphaerales bacterium]